jgi:regulator of protease activity HflC (stomatin/prohibitin superfamily)
MCTIYNIVFLQVGLAIQYSVNVHQALDAYYRLTDPRLQMVAHAHDVVRSALPKLTVDEAFASKEDLSLDILRSLHVQMRVYGHDILDVLLVHLSPNATVQAAMNEMNAAKREKESMRYKAEAGT